MATDGDSRVRASDGEREQYAKILRAAMTEGRLTLEEGEERLSQVYGAKYRDELPPLAADLPDGGRRALFEDPEVLANFRRQARRHFAGHTGLVAVIAAALVGLWAVSHAHFFWPAIPLFFLTIGLVKHARWRLWGAPSMWGHARHWGGPGPGRGRGPWGGRDAWAAQSDSQSGWRR